MALEQSLIKIEEDIQNGDLGKARDRLHGLIFSYPNNLELRKKLGDVYWKLQYPTMAGRYWYLVENKTQEMINACTLFEKECGYDPQKILHLLKFRGNVKIIRDLYAGQILSMYRKKVKEKNDKHGLAKRSWEKFKGKLAAVGCISFLFIIILLIGIGVLTILKWLGLK